MIRLDLSNTVSFQAHRSGWGYCMSKLEPFHSKNGIFIDDFIEKNFGWDLDRYYKGDYSKIPYRKDWIGFLHNPPDVPDWFDVANSPQAILQRKVFQDSLKYCKSLVCLSDYLANWLRGRVNVPVISVKHPTEIPHKKLSIKNFVQDQRKNVVQIGYWLRRMDSIFNLKCDSLYLKNWLPSNKDKALGLLDRFFNQKNDCYEIMYSYSGVNIDTLSNDKFDDLLSKCVVFVDLYDSSANNAVVESIARNTPILINRIPAVEEYLGSDYPLYFKDLDDASSMLYDFDRIFEAHLYLKNMDKTWISGTYFANDLITKLSKTIQ